MMGRRSEGEKRRGGWRREEERGGEVETWRNYRLNGEEKTAQAQEQ